MPDLLTHVLLAYAGMTMAVWYDDRFARHHVSVAMVGAALPDLAKIGLVVDFEAVSVLLGIPLSPLPLHRLGGVLVVAGIGSLLVHDRERWMTFAILTTAAMGHLVLDALIIRADGLTPPYLYPFTWWRPPAGDLYLSSDLWPALVAIGIASLAWVFTARNPATESALELD
ncbi:MAG: hypothetical protein R3324_02740 [Halobacteriales archaeon]|nr:hypothetical protein [Halobacteriales archaeon]